MRAAAKDARRARRPRSQCSSASHLQARERGRRAVRRRAAAVLMEVTAAVVCLDSTRATASKFGPSGTWTARTGLTAGATRGRSIEARPAERARGWSARAKSVGRQQTMRSGASALRFCGKPTTIERDDNGVRGGDSVGCTCSAFSSASSTLTYASNAVARDGQLQNAERRCACAGTVAASVVRCAGPCGLQVPPCDVQPEQSVEQLLLGVLSPSPLQLEQAA